MPFTSDRRIKTVPFGDGLASHRRPYEMISNLSHHKETIIGPITPPHIGFSIGDERVRTVNVNSPRPINHH